MYVILMMLKWLSARENQLVTLLENSSPMDALKVS